ncbi:SH3 domain-containing protein [bacterium]|nr:SH3 domain-containing protein [bacterium]
MFETLAPESNKRNSLRLLTNVLLVGVLVFLMFGASALAAERMSVKVGLANVRSGPSKQSDVAWQVTKYHPFRILKKKGNWYECKDFEGDSGWLSKSLLVKTATVITIRENCNVRSGPGTKNKILFIVDREVPLKVLKRQGRWLEIVHEDGDKGWIHASLVW